MAESNANSRVLVPELSVEENDIMRKIFCKSLKHRFSARITAHIPQ